MMIGHKGGHWGMVDVFISYSREDRQKVGLISEAFEARGLKVWWDPHIKTGAGFRAEIAEALKSAKAVVVVWSEHSVTSRFVVDEADEGALREILFPALIDLVDIPLGFRQIQTADLTRWRGDTRDKSFQEFLDIVTDAAIANGAEGPDVTPDTVEEPEPELDEPKDEVEDLPPPDLPRTPQPQIPQRRSYATTGTRVRTALMWRAIALATLIAGAFGGLAYARDFVFESYRPALIAALALLVFVSRSFTFAADRQFGAASLRLISRSYLVLILFSLVATAPLILESRLYAAALHAVKMQGIEGADINKAAVSPQGDLVATASDDTTVRIWDAASGSQRILLRGHEHWVWSASFSPGGDEVVTASRDVSARLWNVRTGAQTAVLQGHESSIYDASYSPDGTLIASGGADRTVRIWDAQQAELTKTLSGHTDDVISVEFDPTGRLVLSAARDGTARLWNVSSGRTRQVYVRHTDELTDAVLDPTGRLLATSAQDGRAIIWDVTSARVLKTLQHPAFPFSVTFVDGNRLVATGGSDGIVRVWDVASGELLKELSRHEDAVKSVDTFDLGMRIISGSRDNTARVWDVETGKQIQIFGHTTPALPFGFSLDIPNVLTASRAPTPVSILSDPLSVLQSGLERDDDRRRVTHRRHIIGSSFLGRRLTHYLALGASDRNRARCRLCCGPHPDVLAGRGLLALAFGCVRAGCALFDPALVAAVLDQPELGPFHNRCLERGATRAR